MQVRPQRSHFVQVAPVGNLPGNTTGQFVADGVAPTEITLKSGAEVSLPGNKQGAITYYPEMNTYTATPAYNQLQIRATGYCDMGAGVSMNWWCNCDNNFIFDQDNQTIGFVSSDDATNGDKVKVSGWYWVAGGLTIAITKGIASAIAKDIAGDIGNVVANGMIPAAPPTSVQFNGMSNFLVSEATFNNGVVLIGTASSS